MAIYTGFWINWDYGRVRGATLTLPTTQGLILVSFLTLFVQFSGVCFWRVICFILHQWRSSTVPHDGLYHQQQIILRNAITAPNAFWNFAVISVRWNGLAKSSVLKSLPLQLITVVHLGFFAAASLLSSRVTSTVNSGEALLLTPPVGQCGFSKEVANVRNITESGLLDEEQLLILNTEVLLGRLTISKSAAYVRTCYDDDANSGNSACKIFVRPHLDGEDSSASNTSACPFGSGACNSPFAVRYDSGHLHSNKDLGINFPDKDSLYMRRVTQCAPINAEKYATAWKSNVTEAYAGGSNTTVKYYEFGESKRGCEGVPWNETSKTPTTTFCVTQYQKDNFLDAYNLLANTAYYKNESDLASDFKPIPDFQVPDADVTLIQLFRKARYTGRVDDPLFNASVPDPDFKQYFLPSSDLAVLGCTEQYQFCNIGFDKCTSLTGLYEARHQVDKGDLSLTTRQEAAYKVMWKAAWTMALQWSTTVYGNNLLLAREWQFRTGSSTSSPLPANQWQLESWNLHNLSLAVFQRRVNEFAAPEDFEIRPGLPSLKMIEIPNDSTLEICSQQKVRSNEHHAVNVLGMVIILVVGSILILLDWAIEPFWFRRLTTPHGRAKKTDWINTGMLQLHRQTLETRGIGPWDVKDSEFPVLSKRFDKFSPMGARSDSDIPLGIVVGEGQGKYAYRPEPYNGGTYSAVPIHMSGWNVEQQHFSGP